MPCEIEQVGKSRNGKPRWWCKTHGANATGRYGLKLVECEGAYRGSEIQLELPIRLRDFPGGVGIWGAVDPIYDTSGRTQRCGVHVHARKEPGGDKVIDDTFDAVSLNLHRDLLDERKVIITQQTAVAFYISRFLGRDIKSLFCVHCGELHLDSEFYAVKEHKRHLCHACGRNFQDSERGVSNPIIYFEEIFGDSTRQRKIVVPNRALNIDQGDYPGGMKIWASNPALLWTSPKDEEEGIHIHLYKDDTGDPVVDETYSSVRIDGVDLDVVQAQHLMAQGALEYLRNKVVSLKCPVCGEPHFDKYDHGFNPHKLHVCEYCGAEFPSPGRRKLVVSNPLVSVLQKLELRTSNGKC